MESYSENTKTNSYPEYISFEEFSEEDLEIKPNPGDISVSTVQAAIAATTQMITMPIASALFGQTDTQTKAEKFSKKVSEYATSKEVISSLSKEIGEPKETETEEEFIERASNVLRNLLKKKFNV